MKRLSTVRAVYLDPVYAKVVASMLCRLAAERLTSFQLLGCFKGDTSMWTPPSFPSIRLAVGSRKVVMVLVRCAELVATVLI